jgi:hypothetical protein
MAFIANWLYYRNNRSVIACFLFHLSSDLTIGSIQAEEYTKCIATGLLVAITVVIVFWIGRCSLKKRFLFRQQGDAQQEGAGGPLLLQKGDRGAEIFRTPLPH